MDFSVCVCWCCPLVLYNCAFLFYASLLIAYNTEREHAPLSIVQDIPDSLVRMEMLV